MGGLDEPVERRGRFGASVTEVAYGVASQSGEKILVGGLLAAGGKARILLRRYLPDGSPDGTFGVGGKVTTLPLRVARRRG